MYLFLKFLHVLAAIVAVGANITYGIWIGRAQREPEHLRHVLRGIQVLDNRVANPGYVVLLVTGLLMVWVGPWRLTTPWILSALALFAVIAVLGFALFTPLFRRQISALEKHGADSPEYRALARRGARLGAAIALVVALIVYLMVAKPALWGG